MGVSGFDSVIYEFFHVKCTLVNNFERHMHPQIMHIILNVHNICLCRSIDTLNYRNLKSSQLICKLHLCDGSQTPYVCTL